MRHRYIEGKVDFNGDVLEVLRSRDAFVSYRPTMTTFSFLYQQFVPGLSSSLYDKSTVKRENALAYSKVKTPPLSRCRVWQTGAAARFNPETLCPNTCLSCGVWRTHPARLP